MAGAPGDEIQVYGAQRVATQEEVEYFKIGEYNCPFYDKIEFAEQDLSTWSPNNIFYDVPSLLTPGKYDVSSASQYVGYAMKLQSASFWDIDTETTYDFVVMPSISDVSANEGSIKGQIITITGTGFAAEGNVVQLADTNCEVIAESSTEITCILEERADATVDDQGYHAGLKQEFWNNLKSFDDMKNGNAGAADVVNSATQGATINNQEWSYSQRLTGYFKAPQNGDYKFWLSARDQAQLYLSTDNTAANAELIAEVADGSAWRFFHSEETQISDSVSLTAGEYYYIEVLQRDFGGSEHLAVGVQIEGAATGKDVPLTPYTVQELEMVCPTRNEIATYSCSGCTEGSYTIRIDYRDPLDGKIINQKFIGPISATATHAQIKSAFNAHFDVEVRDALDGTGTPIEDTYEVEFLSRTWTTSNHLFTSVTTDGSPQFRRVQSASTPLTGSVTLFHDNKEVTIDYDVSETDMSYALVQLGLDFDIRV